MFLDYRALVILLVGLTLVFYTFIYIHDLPHAVAKEREHPHEEAIHIACWLSLFTLHAIWPLVFIWAASHKKPVDGHAGPTAAPDPKPHDRFAELEDRLKKLEGAAVYPNPSLEKIL